MLLPFRFWTLECVSSTILTWWESIAAITESFESTLSYLNLFLELWGSIKLTFVLTSTLFFGEFSCVDILIDYFSTELALRLDFFTPCIALEIFERFWFDWVTFLNPLALKDSLLTNVRLFCDFSSAVFRSFSSF